MSCYYPNGNLSTAGDQPCKTSGDGPCCPQGWTCESNGLCYLPNQGYYGRYTCTDQTWQSSNCPQICTYDKTAAGDEAILQCSSGSYCCDTNRPTTGCCDTSTSRFSLAALPILADGGTAVGSIGSSPTPSPSASASSSSISASASSSSTSASDTSTSASTSIKSSSSSEAAAKVSSTPTISVLTQIVTENGSQSTLVTSTSANVAVPASTGSPAASSSSSKSLGSVIGPAVGVPVAVLALMALAFFLFWRRRPSRKAHPPPRNMQSNSEEPTPMYGEMKSPVESSPYTGKSELEGSPQVGHPSPNSSTAPPSYRGVAGRPMSELQGSPTAATFRDSRGSELAASTYTGPSTSPRQPDLHAVEEEDQGPAELPGSTYRPFRPPGSS